MDEIEIAILIPCYNEAITIRKVINDFKLKIPSAIIYVFDNNSEDRTVDIARSENVIVHKVNYQGKGNVIRRMFADVEADIYLLIDGDDTYDISDAPNMISQLIDKNLDMVVGCRSSSEISAYRSGHRFGNALLTSCVTHLFGKTFTDMLSGYRVFSRRFVKSFPAMSTGFEIETELTVHALGLRVPTAEISIHYRARPTGSTSKLNTYKDGLRILLTIVRLYQHEKPLIFFSTIGGAISIIAIGLAIPIFMEFFASGTVPKLPTAVLITGMMVISFLSFMAGLILHTVTRGRQEMKWLFYLVATNPKRK
jgi:glycosyltransferase involved in cell wall biosynthesis